MTSAWEQHRSEQLAEYGTYVATHVIYHGNAVAYNVGHPVPVSNVRLYGYDKQGLVARVDGVSDEPSVDREDAADEETESEQS